MRQINLAFNQVIGIDHECIVGSPDTKGNGLGAVVSKADPRSFNKLPVKSGVIKEVLNYLFGVVNRTSVDNDPVVNVGNNGLQGLGDEISGITNNHRQANAWT